ncbi:MAG TPA: hypothetical protein VKE22_07905 [Haliangiales bacterium]|nr:hypothetical protein [Haliangiales bacterium]
MRLLLVLALLGAPKIADACSCATFGTIRLLPGPRDGAPLNVRFLLEVPPIEDSLKPMAPEDILVTLRGPKGAVAAEVARWGAAELRWIQLTPKAPLAPATRYSVHVSVGGKDSLLGQVVTGDAADTTAPTFEGVTKAAVVVEGVSPGRCTTGEAYVVLTIGAAKDDATPPQALRYRVWLADDQGAIDYDRPPTAIVAARGGELHLGRPSICTAKSFVLPDRPTFKLGVKAVDLAGNASAPSVVEVSVPPPPKGRRADIDKTGREDQ